jgi:GrpB protein
VNRPGGTVEVVDHDATWPGRFECGTATQVEDYRLFLAFLRADASAAARYATLKRDLAGRYADRRQAYVEAKHAEVDLLMLEARRWRDSAGAAGT